MFTFPMSFIPHILRFVHVNLLMSFICHFLRSVHVTFPYEFHLSYPEICTYQLTLRVSFVISWDLYTTLDLYMLIYPVSFIPHILRSVHVNLPCELHPTYLKIRTCQFTLSASSHISWDLYIITYPVSFIPHILRSVHDILPCQLHPTYLEICTC